jgi:hypothetical protein
MWDFFEPEDNQWYRWDLNGASAFLCKKEDSWQISFNQISFQYVTNTFGGPYLVDAPEPNNAEISFVSGKGKKAALRPYFSGMPYLVTIRDNMRIMPGAETRFHVMLPPLLRFEVYPHEAALAEQMPFLLSHTWFGNSMTGMLCYSLPTLLHPSCDGDIMCSQKTENDITKRNSDIHTLIYCDLLVRNISKTEIDLKQAAIYTDMLNIYEKDGKLVTDDVVLDSLNDGNLKMSIHHHGQNKGYKKLSSSISGGTSEMFIRRGVEFLKTMTTI